jgi:hypothetical protein
MRNLVPKYGYFVESEEQPRGLTYDMWNCGLNRLIDLMTYKSTHNFFLIEILVFLPSFPNIWTFFLTLKGLVS